MRPGCMAARCRAARQHGAAESLELHGRMTAGCRLRRAPAGVVRVVRSSFATPSKYFTVTAAKDRKQSPPLGFKSASLDQIWSCLQRCLLFEEPSGRWAKLMAQVSRHVNGKAKDLSQLTLAAQQDAFRAVFGTPEDLLEPTARTFNLVLAMQDLRRFDAADFEIWFFSQGSDDIPLESAAVFSEIAEKVLGEKPTAAQAASLAHAWDVVPYWRILESSGPWADDPLARFACSFLRKLDKLKTQLEAESLLVAEAEFSRLLRDSRAKLPGNFQAAALVLVEGNTEAILLPKFFSLTGNKTVDPAAMFIACGGANQLLRKYLHLRDVTKLPILCVMDHDASIQIDTLEQVMRDGDQLYIWSVGEIEDTFSLESLLDSLNAYLITLGVNELLLPQDLKSGLRRTELLDRLWRSHGLGDFDKVGFADFQAKRLKSAGDVPIEGQKLMNTIRAMISGKHEA